MAGRLVLQRLGDTDCEAFVEGIVAQPVNAVSSLAFLAVGGAFIAWALRQPPGRRVLAAVFGAAIAANGIGGVLFHGPAWPGSAWVHDVAIVAPLVFVVLFDVSCLRRMTNVQLLGAFGVVLGAAGLLLAGVPQASNAVSAVFAALALGTELATAGRRYASRRARQAYAVTIGALVVGMASNLLGRTGGPLCAADSPLQGHAVWHVCMAVALGGWGVAALVADRRSVPSERVASAA